MTESLRAKQYLPLSHDERAVLQAEAAKRDMTTGLLSRALFLYALDRVDSPSIERQIELEKAATKKRIHEGARTAARKRWGHQEGSEK